MGIRRGGNGPGADEGEAVEDDGVTTDLEDRVRQHGEKFLGGFTSRYNVNGLVYFERFGDIRMAIAREKQVKGWRREKRVALIESKNPHWVDLYEEMISARKLP